MNTAANVPVQSRRNLSSLATTGRLKPERVELLLNRLPNWRVSQDGKSLSRTFKFTDEGTPLAFAGFVMTLATQASPPLKGPESERRMSLTFASQLDNWDLLSRTLKPKVVNMPELAAEQSQLEAYVAQGKAFQAAQAEALATIRQVVRMRRQLQKDGQQLHDQMTSVLKGKLGFDSNDLYSYGLRPRRSRKSSGTPSAPDPTPTPGTPAPQPELAGPAK